MAIANKCTLRLLRGNGFSRDNETQQKETEWVYLNFQRSIITTNTSTYNKHAQQRQHNVASCNTYITVIRGCSAYYI